MNRELKFRAWDKAMKQLKIVSAINFYYGFVYLEKEKYVYHLNEVELLQYSGFADSNGFDIYEGHILYATTYGFVGVGRKMEDGKVWLAGNVVFCDGGFKLKDEMGNLWELTDVLEEEEVYVRGNIYEDAELLKEEM